MTRSCFFLPTITLTVIPAKAGIQCVADSLSFVPAGQWIPACAGMTTVFSSFVILGLNLALGGCPQDPGHYSAFVIPAKACFVIPAKAGIGSIKFTLFFREPSPSY